MSLEGAGNPKRPTIVLIHGAFADSSSWNEVVHSLRGDGYPVLAIANPLRSKDIDGGYAASVLDGISGPTIVVGHSMGGFAATNAATGKDNVQALVYVAAFAPDAGESPADLAGRFPGSSLEEALVPFALPDGGSDLYIAQDKYHDQFAADLAPGTTALMAATQRPITAADLNDPAGEPAWKTVPTWFVFGDADLNIPVDAHRFMADRAGSRRTVEIEGASHVVGMSHPDAVADLIGEAALASAGAAA